MNRAFVLIMALLSSQMCKAELQIEPLAGNTLSFNRLMVEGEEVSLSCSGLRAGEVFRVHKCGPKCRSASPYRMYSQDDYAESWADSFTLEGGEYYFWLENALGKTKKYGSIVKPESVNGEDGAYIVRFESGSVVRVRLNKPLNGDAARGAR